MVMGLPYNYCKMDFVKQYLDTGKATEGSLLIVKTIAETLVEEADKNLLSRDIIAEYYGPENISGSSIDVDLETPNTLDVRKVSEGSEIPFDNQDYTSFNLKPEKYGVSIRITREMIEDGKWNLLERNIKTAGKRMAENETSIIVSQALDNAANTVTGGSEVTIPNILDAMNYLDENDYNTTDFIIGKAVLRDIRNIDTFVEVDKSGSDEVLRTGFKGVLFGMKVHSVSTNAGMTTTSAYVIDRDEAIVLAEKRRLTIENLDLPLLDMSAATVTHRIIARHLRAEAIAKITST